MNTNSNTSQPERRTLIAVRNVDKTFRRGDEEIHALRGVTLDVYRNEYLSIMGPSGSGKTTLFNMMGALDRPSGGEVSVDRISLPSLSPRELSYFRCRHIGYVFQTYNLIPWLSALGNVMLPLTFLGRPELAASKRAEEVLTIVGLGHRLDHKPAELSGGQQQRVAIARALANQPSVILADEPTANLDMHTGEEIINLLKTLCRQEGVTVITATHDHKMLAASDRIVWIKGGRVDRIQNVADMQINVGSITPQ
jgi:putative ABC transport system ATP-binding protein